MYCCPSTCCAPHHGHMGWPPMLVGVVLLDGTGGCLPCPPPVCEVGRPMTIPHEIEASGSTTTVTAMVGGREAARVTVEYLVAEGAPTPATVKATATSGGSETVWSDTDPAAGFHVQEAVLTVQPGSTLTLEVANIMARLRWCETICC